ncbi:ribonuclease J [Ferroacidibacillus organovorans]|uniref:ribonuclease J n=1 Tax=Ferroacidibacillus organovorans TaxID=1765683 RepID=UPI001C4E0EF7
MVLLFGGAQLSKNYSNKLSIVPLGGIGEIGKNMTAYAYGNDMIVVDAGLKFPDEEMLGIDIVIPDISYLTDNKQRLRGIFITHGHEDHIGGLPYVLKSLQVPVYATRLTLGLIEGKLREHGILDQSKLIPITNESEVTLGHFKVSCFRVNHSIPDSVGFAIDTPEGVVVQTGDFKFDQTPVDGIHADYAKMTALGERGVLALLSDSTNAERPGFTPSERSVGATIERVFQTAPGRVILATFASNIHRVQQVIRAAERNGRKVAIVGRSMVNNVSVAKDLGYLEVEPDTLIELEELSRFETHEVALLTTGSQGEPMSALTRMARATHRKVEIYSGDTVIIASSPIPGNEKSISRTIDLLQRIGADVIYQPGSGVHVSGHGSQEELKLMLNFIRPKYFVPVHGEFRMLRKHAELATATGVNQDHIFMLELGDVFEIQDGTPRVSGKVTAGAILIDGLGVGDVGNIVLRDRKLLSQDGILVVVLTMSKQTGQLLSGPDIISRGFVYVRESEELLDEANRVVAATLQRLMTDRVSDWSGLKMGVRDALTRFLYEQTRRRPMVLPIIMEV